MRIAFALLLGVAVPAALGFALYAASWAHDHVEVALLAGFTIYYFGYFGVRAAVDVMKGKGEPEPPATPPASPPAP